VARGAEATLFAGEGEEEFVVAVGAAVAGEAGVEVAAVEEGADGGGSSPMPVMSKSISDWKIALCASSTRWTTVQFRTESIRLTSRAMAWPASGQALRTSVARTRGECWSMAGASSSQFMPANRTAAQPQPKESVQPIVRRETQGPACPP
jgi:hypothetical protein